MLKEKKSLIALVALVAAVALCAGLWFAFAPQGTAGGKEIAITITHGDGSVKEVTLNTEQEFLRFALEEENLIEGTESEYGLFVLTVDGETADDANQEWWSFTQGGEWLMTGVDTTPIADGDAFEITLTVGY